jgi:hypothetical protein
VVEFNAWETDHAGDPFVAIVAELTEGFQNTDAGLALLEESGGER